MVGGEGDDGDPASPDETNDGGDAGADGGDGNSADAPSSGEPAPLPAAPSYRRKATLDRARNTLQNKGRAKGGGDGGGEGRDDEYCTDDDDAPDSAARTKSFHTPGCADDLATQTKSRLRSQIESERKRRADVERRLDASNKVRDELRDENARLERRAREVQAGLDEAHEAARTSKYGAHEQTARIKELERKLKSEKERVEELERERDAVKEEFDQDLEEQKGE